VKDTVDLLVDEALPRARLALLVEHFSRLDDEREPWRVMYPLSEVLLLLTCATIASCDDFDEIAAWGKHHLEVLRRFAPFHFGIPCERWLRTLVNRVDPVTFGRCFEGWIKALWPGRHDLIAIDGKTSRRTHDKEQGIEGASYAERLRDQRPAHSGAAQRAGKDQRNHRHTGAARSSRRPSNSTERWSPSMPWAAKSRSPTRSLPTRPISCSP